MEIVGYIPIDSKILNQVSTDIKLHLNKLYVEGKQTINDNEYIVSISARCISKALVPSVDDETGTKQEYDRYNKISRGLKITCNSNLDILTNESFELIAYSTGDLITMPENCLKGLTVVNILEVSDVQYSDIKQVIDSSLDEIKKVNLPDIDWDNIFKRQGKDYADIYLDSTFSMITDGEVKSRDEQTLSGIEKVYYWEGKFPLDRLIYTIQSNLDILMKNNKIKGDVYGNLYATLMAQAIQSATVLEQARIQAYEQASQFQIKSRLEYYLGVITAKLNIMKSLAEVQVQFLQKSLVKSQIKLYYVQTNGFKANNISKLFTAQLDGATTAFSAGMTETPPPVFNSGELMQLYTEVGSDTLII